MSFDSTNIRKNKKLYYLIIKYKFFIINYLNLKLVQLLFLKLGHSVKTSETKKSFGNSQTLKVIYNTYFLLFKNSINFIKS